MQTIAVPFSMCRAVQRPGDVTPILVSVFFFYFLQEIRGRCEGKCEVTVESRSYCKRCRLQKCFAVGMKRELILSKTLFAI